MSVDADKQQGSEKKHTLKDYKRDLKPVWCTGCGDFGVLQAIYRSLNALDLDPENVAIVSGIGCSSRLPGYVNTYGFNSVHGRALPIAQGVKIARPDLQVLASTVSLHALQCKHRSVPLHRCLQPLGWPWSQIPIND